ncbi:uncharacterized protein V6R79_000883 [Siganus canaliculatus]
MLLRNKILRLLLHTCCNSDTVLSDSTDEAFSSGSDDDQIYLDPVFEYVAENPRSTNTKLFSFLALLNAYVPGSYLLMSECLQILGPPDPIHGGPPFEKRMEPFIDLIKTSSQNSEVCLKSQDLAQTAVQRLAKLSISRSATAKNFIISLCSDQPQPHIIEFIKDILTKRISFENEYKKKFSELIEDILQEEQNPYNAVSVLKIASEKLNQNPIFPQTISRLYYINIRRGIIDYDRAEQWARKAIDRAPDNSFVADTLGQVFKNRLLRIRNGNLEEINKWAKEAFTAFKDVETKADREEGPEMEGTAVSTSGTFNNRGRFGFIQVAKITYDKLCVYRATQIIRHQTEVREKFQFFEWYLTYSQPDDETLEPPYFWRDVVCCYNYYTGSKATESTSFAGLLDCLSHGFFTSKGGRAGLQEAKKTVADLEAICADLKTTYEANTADVETAERYILSNVILSNNMPNSQQLAPMTTLRSIIHSFLSTDVGQRSPEFYLLVLLLFWPEGQLHLDQEDDEEGVEQQAAENEAESQNATWEDESSNEELEAGEGESAVELMFDLDLQKQVTFMNTAFEREYAKYLRGRHLCPLFFLGKGPGLSKWIHKSRLDVIVEKLVDAELVYDVNMNLREKWRKIHNMWISGVFVHSSFCGKYRKFQMRERLKAHMTCEKKEKRRQQIDWTRKQQS